MNTSEFNQSPTAAQLNESMFKRFGKKINFDNYTREELENYRNLLRTKVNQTEANAGFNDLLANESYQQDQYMLTLLNTKIKELLGESALSERAVSKAQQKAAGAALAATRSGNKKGLKGASKEMAKMGKKELEKFAGTKQKGLPEKKTDESRVSELSDTTKANYKTKAAADVKKRQPAVEKAFSKKKADITDGEMANARSHGNRLAGLTRANKKATATNESVMKANYKQIIEGLQQFIAEDEEGKAKDITAGTDMVNDFTSWMQRVGQYQTKIMIELADSIRANFGQAASDAFKTSIAPALAEALSSLTQSRETITRAVAVLAGEENAEQPMGELPGLEGDLAPQGDTMNPADVTPVPAGDDFAASDAAAGGTEVSGREMRESKEALRAQRLAEEHSLIFKLSK